MINRRGESGQVLVLTALSMAALLGFVALATDVGLLFNAKRKLQIVADAAATAAAINYYYSQSTTSAQSAGQTAAAANGASNGSGGTSVVINAPPTSGYHTTAGYFEAIVSQPNPTFFMKVFNYSSVTVVARAVAGIVGPSDACIYVLDPSASGAMTLQGSFNVDAPACGVIVDSNSSNALQFTGGAGTLTAAWVGVAGGDGGQTGDSTPAPVTGVVPINNPLPNMTGPNPSTDCAHTSAATTVTSTSPEASWGGIVCFTNTGGVTLSNVTLPTGIYVFEYGVTLSGEVSTIPAGETNPPSTGYTGGATLDIYGGALSINTNTILELVAPSDSTGLSTAGIALLEPAPNSNPITIQKGNATGTITGIILAPDAQLYLQDSGGDNTPCTSTLITNCAISFYSDIIVGQLFDKTATMAINSYSSAYPTDTPLKKIGLVE